MTATEAASHPGGNENAATAAPAGWATHDPPPGTGSIQAALSRWFAMQALIGLSLICVAIYAVTSWSFQVKQTSEFERQAELIRHLIQESAGDPLRNELRHKLDDFFSTHPDISLVLRRDDEIVYASTPNRASARWAWMPAEQ